MGIIGDLKFECKLTTELSFFNRRGSEGGEFAQRGGLQLLGLSPKHIIKTMLQL